LAGAIEKAAASSTDNDLANFTGESPAFLATLHNSIIDSMQGFRLAPARVRLFVADGEVIGIVPERAPLPVSGNVDEYFLEFLKTGGIRVFTKDQVANATGAAESFFNRSLQDLAAGSS